MEEIRALTIKEKKLLHGMGKNPEISLKELVNYTGYKRVSTISRKIEEFKKCRILNGPLYDLNYDKLCKNPLRKLYCILETKKDYGTVISYLRLIKSIISLFPLLSIHRNTLAVTFYSSNNKKTIELLELLKDVNIITDYVVHTWSSKRLQENPNLFGDSTPSLNNLLDPCDTPDMSLECHDTVWNTCDITILPYLRTGFKGTRLIEILKAEKKLDRTWTYDQMRYSREKMKKNGLIKKGYAIAPVPPDQCTQFTLFLKGKTGALTKRMVCNFAKKERVYKEYVLCEKGGLIVCTCHPLFPKDLMSKLDSIEEILEKELYQIRSCPPGFFHQQYPEFTQYYNFDEQVLEYPLNLFEKNIKEKIENENL